MRLSNLLKRTITRQTLVESGGVKEYQTPADEPQANKRGSIQPISDEQVNQEGEALGYSFYLYTAPQATIKEGDKVTDDLGNTYTVKGLETRPGYYNKYLISGA